MLSNQPNFPPSPTDDFTQQISVRCDSAIVIGDSEIPDHDCEVFAMAAELAERLAIDTLVINGDFIDGDAFSNWPKASLHGQPFATELELARKTIGEFLKVFKRIFIVSGNHDKRLALATKGQVWIGMFFDDMNQVQASHYSYLNLETKEGKWLICHPKNYSRIPLATARELASVKLCHVLTGHNHHLSYGHDKSGQFWVVDGGCCRDSNKTAYKSMSITTHPEWIPGFVIIHEGIPTIVSKKTFKTLYKMFS